jgi:hypothetical protein
VGLIIFFAIALGCAAIWHAFLPRYLAASFGATVTTVLTFQGVTFVQLGHLDPFFLIAAVTTSAIALLISLLVGLPFQARRKYHRGEKNAL